MKNRDYKHFEKGEIFHAYNRGVGKIDIFLDDQDRSVFMNRLYENLFPDKYKNEQKLIKEPKYKRKLLPPNSFELICYCLMPNHFHLVIKQLNNIPISQLISKVCTGYSMYFNKKHERVGSLFQDVFKAVHVENNSQLLWLSLYVHENPIKAGLIQNLDKYKWSSYLSYKGMEKGICKPDIILNQYTNREKYFEYFSNQTIRTELQNQMLVSGDILIDE